MGRQSGNIYRTTISIPLDLKQRMDATGQGVNWSAVAARAFEDKLAEIAAAKKEKTVDDVIQRLRASKRRADDEQRKDGFEAGEAWAKDEAETDELERLERFLARLDGEPSFGRDEFFSDFGQKTYSTAEGLYFALHPEDDRDRRAAEHFWEEALGDNVELASNDSFLRGFAEGAVELWQKYKDKL
jgi:hypothetical protein